MSDVGKPAQPVTVRLWPEVRGAADRMIEAGGCATVTEAINILMARGEVAPDENMRMIARTFGGQDEAAIAFAIGRIAAGISNEVQASYRSSPEAFAEFRAAVVEFLDMVAPKAAEIDDPFQAPPRPAKGAAAKVIAAVRRNLSRPDRLWWPLGDKPAWLDQDQRMRYLMPLERLLPLWASWAKK